MLGQAGKGALLRREGIYSSLIAAWRARRDQVDIYSRYTIGWLIADRESAVVAEQLLGDTIAKNGIDRDTLTLHADDGSSTAPKPVAFLLADLGVTKSHSRQHTRNDNPLSEAQFRTSRCRPEFPATVASLPDARAFCRQFFGWHNTEHRHSGVPGTPRTTSTMDMPVKFQTVRAEVLDAAYTRNPNGSSASTRNKSPCPSPHGSTSRRTRRRQTGPVNKNLTNPASKS